MASGDIPLSSPMSLAGIILRRQGTYLLVEAVRSQVEVVEGDEVVLKEAQKQNQVHAICKLQRKLSDNSGACVGWTDTLHVCRKVWECPQATVPTPRPHPHSALPPCTENSQQSSREEVHALVTHRRGPGVQKKGLSLLPPILLPEQAIEGQQLSFAMVAMGP